MFPSSKIVIVNNDVNDYEYKPGESGTMDTTQVPVAPKITITAHVRCIGPEGNLKWEADTEPVVIGVSAN